MSRDWLEDLSGRDRVEWGKIKAMASSAMVMMVSPTDGQGDVKFAIELGFAIMMDKPILTMVLPGVEIPRRLRQVSDMVVQADPGTPEGKKAIEAGIAELTARFGLDKS